MVFQLLWSNYTESLGAHLLLATLPPAHSTHYPGFWILNHGSTATQVSPCRKAIFHYTQKGKEIFLSQFKIQKKALFLLQYLASSSSFLQQTEFAGHKVLAWKTKLLYLFLSVKTSVDFANRVLSNGSCETAATMSVNATERWKLWPCTICWFG